MTSMTQGEGEGPELQEVQTRRELLNQELPGRGRYAAEGLRGGGGVTTPKSKEKVKIISNKAVR
ncbi:MAG: hypothetical protein GY696_12495, partial [Gammaproteobacteria bacterium]|nr:hypothetical protein [Gammaproteobacteria bacterium]